MSFAEKLSENDPPVHLQSVSQEVPSLKEPYLPPDSLEWANREYDKVMGEYQKNVRDAEISRRLGLEKIKTMLRDFPRVEQKFFATHDRF